MPQKRRSGKVVQFPTKQNKERPKRPIAPLLFVFLFLIFLFLFFSWFRSFLFVRLVNIDILEKETLDITLDGLPSVVVRDEEVVYAPMTGKVTQLIPEGKRAQKNETVVAYDHISLRDYDFSDEEEISQEISRLVTKAEQELEALRAGDGSGLSDTVGRLYQLDRDMKEMVGELESEHEHEHARESFGVKASAAGLISYYIDGLEDRLNLNTISDLTPDQIKRYRDQEEITSYEQQAITRRAPIFKVVDNYKWYLIVVCPIQALETFEDRRTLQVKLGFDEGTVHTARVVDSLRFDQEGFLVLELTREVADFWRERFTEVSLVQEQKKGFAVPRRALTSQEGEDGVYVVKNGIVRFRPVQVIHDYQDSGKVFVQAIEETPLSRGDKLITNSIFVKEGDKIR